MPIRSLFHFRQPLGILILLVCPTGLTQVRANPTGGVVSQGTAHFNSSGSQLTINQTSANAFINWQTFNIGSGETVTFNQPSSTSVAWNFINDPNASSINGNLNANGYVVLQNPNGFTVGGLAAITAHGLVMTTASTPALNLSSGGAWSFDAPPPTAKIVNYGKINVVGGGSAYLIASDIINDGTISAPNGNVGLYAGQKVLLSMSPDGRGLSAEVTLPQGSVDNEGDLIADAGSIAAQAQFVNQNGLVQANSVQNINGTIELVASDSIKLGASSVISARGDVQGSSAGGSITIKADNNFSDQKGSTINVSGGAQGGDGGSVEISASSMAAVNSQIIGQAQSGWVGGKLLLDPDFIELDESGGDGVNVNGSSGSVSVDDSPGGTLFLDVGTSDFSFSDSVFIGLSQITLQAKYDITLDAGTVWNLSGSTGQSSGQLNLEAGRNIIFGDGSKISDANNWSVSLQAGYDFVNNVVQSGIGSIYLGDFDGSNPLNNSGSIQTAQGSISLTAGQDVLLGSGGVTTIKGGDISVTALNGDVNSGTSTSGFNYLPIAPYYTPFSVSGLGTTLHINFNQSNLGGIATAGGGNVTINAGGDVISFPTTTVAAGDPGIGAFGSQSGNVTITAGGSVYGNYIVMNGAGIINAGQNIGTSEGNQNVALSLAKGSWDLNAQGDIYLQEVRNPNGVFNGTASGGSGPGDHLFDYDPSASVSLTAGDGVHIIGSGLPRPEGGVPLILPPTLIINAGSGGVTLQTPTAIDSSGNSVFLSDYDITLFPSAFGNLEISTTDGGWLTSVNADGTAATLLMSDSGKTQWFVANSGPQPFGETDHSSTPAELNNDDPVTISLTGNDTVGTEASMENIILQTDKKTQIIIDGDMIDCSFYGVNLQAGDVTSINVGGQIFNAGSFNSISLSQGFPSLPKQDVAPGTIINWYTILQLAIDPTKLPTQSLSGVTPSQLSTFINNALMFPGINPAAQLAYNSDTKTLTAIGALSLTLLNVLEQSTLTVVRYGPNGLPLLDSSGHFVTDTINLLSNADAAKVSSLYTASQGAPPLGVGSGAFIVGGTGEFNINADSISLGNSDGILSVGNGRIAGKDYSFLTSTMLASDESGATINVVANTLNMPSSTIAALGGGDVNVTCNAESSDGVSMDLGSQDLIPFENQIMNGFSGSNIGLGIYTSGGGDVNVTAFGDINIDSSRIASFNGGNVNITSLTGNVNAGSGGTIAIPINVFSTAFDFPFEPFEYVYANGIVANTLAPLPNGKPIPHAATIPGNITVNTPQGNIEANLGGILQESLNGTLPVGPTINLTAGTPADGDWNSTEPPLYVGNIDMGQSGVIGGTVNVKATGKITGLLISQHNANVTGQSIGNLTVLAAGTANVSGSSSGAGITIVGGQGVNASGIGSGATLLGQNVSVNGGAAQSTLGNSANATATSQSAAQQSTQTAAQQVAGNDNGDGDQDKKKKNPEIRKVGRVTVILSAAIPPK